MVTPQVRGVAEEFQMIASHRDITGVAVIGLGGAGGGVFAQWAADEILPMLGMPAEPGTTTEYAASSGVKAALGLGLGFAGLRLGGTGGMVLGVAGLGALIVAGADAVALASGMMDGNSSSAARRRSRSRRQPRRSRSKSRSSSPSPTPSASSSGGYGSGSGVYS